MPIGLVMRRFLAVLPLLRGAARVSVLLRALTAAFLCLAVGLTGCGTGSNPDRASAPHITKEAYVARVNAICKHYNDLQASLGPPSGSLQEQAATAHKVNALSFRKIADAQEVPAPAGHERITASVLADFAGAIRMADSSTRLVLSDPKKANEAAQTAVSLMNEVGARLQAYGLTACAQ
jgi:hypothetical protein